MPEQVRKIFEDVGAFCDKKDPKSIIRFGILIFLGIIAPIILRLVQHKYTFFADADIAIPPLVIAIAMTSFSNKAYGYTVLYTQISFLISGIFALILDLVVWKFVQDISLQSKLFQGLFGFFMSLSSLFIVVLMSRIYRTDNSGSSKDLKDTNLIFIFLAIIPVFTTTTIYLTGNLKSWGIQMIPSTSGFLLAGLAILVGVIVKSAKVESLGIVAALLMFILGYLVFIASLPFVLESASTSDYMAVFEIVSPLYFFSFVALLPPNKSRIISKVFGLN